MVNSLAMKAIGILSPVLSVHLSLPEQSALRLAEDYIDASCKVSGTSLDSLSVVDLERIVGVLEVVLFNRIDDEGAIKQLCDRILLLASDGSEYFLKHTVFLPDHKLPGLLSNTPYTEDVED